MNTHVRFLQPWFHASNPGCPLTHVIFAFTSQVLELQACATTPSLNMLFVVSVYRLPDDMHIHTEVINIGK
jgi:hypothetical protein